MKRKGHFTIDKPTVRRVAGGYSGYFMTTAVRTDTTEFDFVERVDRKPNRVDVTAFRRRAYDAFCRALLGPRPL